MVTDTRRTPILLYHDVCAPGEAPEDNFAVTGESFRAQMAYLAANGLRGVSLASLLAETPRGGRAGAPGADARTAVVLTFDDGDVSHHDVVLPILGEAGFNATFFVIAGEIGDRGRMDEAMLREMAASGMELGSHGLRHTFLTAYDEEALVGELAASKRILEGSSAGPVTSLSVPRGFYNGRVLRAARAAGFAAACVSDAGYNDFSGPPPFVLKRFAMRSGLDPRAFGSIVRGRPAWSIVASELLRARLRAVLGHRAYDRMRALRYGARRPEGQKGTPKA
jgi:peptidoglycan/xylan/chitin deacetylase (PgdA/CDA1 family)